MAPFPFFYKQPNDWTCGPAVARIILHLLGKPKTLRDIIRELGTTRQGTANRDLARLFRKHRLSFTEKNQASLSDIKTKLKRHWIVTAYWIPSHREAHYSIITKVTAARVHFHDTWFGSNHSYSRPHFIKNWCDDRWFMSVKKTSAAIPRSRPLSAQRRRLGAGKRSLVG